MKHMLFKNLRPSKLDTMEGSTAPQLTMEQIMLNQFIMQGEMRSRQEIDYTASSVRTYLDSVTAFKGDPTDLVRFLKAIETIQEAMAELPILEATLRLEPLKNKLEGRTRSILRENSDNWNDIKSLLIRPFSDQRSLGELHDNLEKIKFNNNIQTTFSAVQFALTRVLDKIELSDDDRVLKSDRIGHAKERAYCHFRSLIPENCKASLNGNTCRNVHDAMNILKAEGLLNENFHQQNNNPRNQNRGFYNKYDNDANNHSHSSQQQYHHNQSYPPQQQQNSKTYPKHNNNSGSGDFRQDNSRQFNNNNSGNPRQNNNYNNSNNSGNSRQYNNRNNSSGNYRQHNNNRYDNNLENSRQFTNYNSGNSNNYPDSGMQRSHEPMDTTNTGNFHMQASENPNQNYPSSESRAPNV